MDVSNGIENVTEDPLLLDCLLVSCASVMEKLFD